MTKPLPTPRSIRFMGAGGLTIAGDAFGDPDATPVVLLHGGGQTRHSWGGTAARLAAAGWYAIALDARGHGDSQWDPDGDYTLDAYANDLRTVLKQLGRKAFVVGASLGGLTALLVEGEADEPLTLGIVLVDIAARMEPEGVERILAFMRRYPEGFAHLDEAADAVAEYMPHRPRPKDSSRLAKNLRQGEDGRWRWHWDPAFLGTDQHHEGSDMGEERMTAAAENIRVPTLLVRGRFSDVLSEDGVEHFLEVVPHAEFVNVADAGHMVAGDDNDVFTQAVVEWLTKARPAATS